MKWILIISIILLTACMPQEPINKEPTKFSCNDELDCVSTCGSGCVNKNWAKNYEDPCINIRAFDCSCINNMCYTDGNAPKNV